MDTAGPGPPQGDPNPVGRLAQNFAHGLSEVSDLINVPMAYSEAAIHDVGAQGTPFGEHWNQVGQDWAKGGAHQVSENDVYFSHGSLERVLADPKTTADQKSRAQFFLDHPWIAGTADFATSFLNPVNLASGALGKGVGVLAKVPRIAHELDSVLAATHLDRFAAARAGVYDLYLNAQKTGKYADGSPWVQMTNDALHQAAMKAEYGARQVVGALGTGRKAFFKTLDIFDRKDIDTRREIVHRSQAINWGPQGEMLGVNPAEKGFFKTLTDPTEDADIDQRAQKYREAIMDLTQTQVQKGVLPFQRVKDPRIWSPMRRSYDQNPEEIDPEARELEESMRASGGRGFIKDTAAAKGPHAKYDTVKQATLASRQLDADLQRLEPTAKQYEQLIAQRDAQPKGSAAWYKLDAQAKPLEAEAKQFATMQKGHLLREDWDPAENFKNLYEQRTRNGQLEDAMKTWLGLGPGLNLLREGEPDAMFARTNRLPDVMKQRFGGVPSAQDKVMQTRAIDFLSEAGATPTEAKQFTKVLPIFGKVAAMFGPGYNTLQELARQGIVANPIVHGGWNLMFQYLAAGGSLKHLLTAQTKWYADAEKYLAALEREAPRTLGGTDAWKLYSHHPSELSVPEKVAYAGSWASEKNQQIVFDWAERHYATALYRTFLDRGKSAEEAGTMVRKALGDYANVSNVGLDKIARQAFFFYPWLKTVLPFWIKTGMFKPQSWQPMVSALHQEKVNAGDPNANTETENPFGAYVGGGRPGDASTRPQYFDLMAPQRILQPALEWPEGLLRGDPGEIERGYQGIVGNRFNPATKALVDQMRNFKPEASQPFNLVTGYAPIQNRLGAIGAGAVDYVPGLVKGFVSLAQRLMHANAQTTPQIIGELVGGTGVLGLTPAQAARKKSMMARGYREVQHFLNIQQPDRAWASYQKLQNRLNAANLGGLDIESKADETNPLPIEGQKGENALPEPEEQPQPESSPSSNLFNFQP